MDENKAEEETPKLDDGEDDDDNMQLEDAPKSEIPEPIDDKSDPGMLAKLKKEEDEQKDSNDIPSFLKAGVRGGKNKIKAMI